MATTPRRILVVEDHARSREAGFLLHLTKPIDSVALCRILELAKQELGEPLQRAELANGTTT